MENLNWKEVEGSEKEKWTKHDFIEPKVMGRDEAFSYIREIASFYWDEEYDDDKSECLSSTLA